MVDKYIDGINYSKKTKTLELFYKGQVDHGKMAPVPKLGHSRFNEATR